MGMEVLDASFPVFLLALVLKGHRAGSCCLTVLHPQIFDLLLCVVQSGFVSPVDL